MVISMVDTKGIDNFRAALQAQHDTEQQAKDKAKNTQRKLKRLNSQEVYFVLRSYFSGALQKWDNEDTLPTGMAITIRHFFARTTGESLSQRCTHQTIKDIISTLDREPTRLGGVPFADYQEHLLACAVEARDFTHPDYEDLPPPTTGQTRKALEQFGELLHDRVLNR